MNIRDILTAPNEPLCKIVEDMPFAEYCEYPGINSSTLKKAWDEEVLDMESLKFAFESSGDDDDTPSMQFGRALHCLLLEPKEFGQRYTYYEGTRNERHKAYQDFLSDHPGMEILKEKGPFSWDWCLQAGDKFSKQPLKCVSRWISGSIREVTVLATVRPGMQGKARLDIVSRGACEIVDVKTSARVGPRKFGTQFFGLNYDMQLAFYRWIVELTFGQKLPVKVIAIKNKPPFSIVPYFVHEEVLDRAMVRVHQTLDKLAECLRTDIWPGLSDGEPQPLYVPNYAMEEIDQVDWGEAA